MTVGALGINASRRALALRVAGEMLDHISIPADAQRLTSKPTDATALINRPEDQIYLNASVTSTRFYRVAATPAAVLAAIRAGLPSAVTIGGSGSQGDADLTASFEYPVIDPDRLGLRQLSVQASTTTDAQGTVVRVDGEVQSIAERLPGQAIPRAARFLDITRPADVSLPGPRGQRLRTPAVSLMLSRPAQVTALARDVNALPFSGNLTGVAFDCPVVERFPPTVTYTFRTRAGARPLATLHVQAATPTTVDPCASSLLIVDGHRQPDLMDGGVMLRQTDALLGVKLVTPS